MRVITHASLINDWDLKLHEQNLINQVRGVAQV